MGDPTLGPLRSAMKFSMWTWAAYWPGGGLMLLAAGMMDPVSIAVALFAMGGLLLVLATGALRTESQGKMTARQWLLERPIYLLVLLVVCTAGAAFIESSANIGLFVFSGLFVASIVLCIVRLRAHVRQQGLGLFSSGADQTFLLFGMVGLMGLIVFLDSVLVAGVDSPAPMVALLNWVQLLYPPLLLVAARPFREKLNFSLVRRLVVRPKAEPKADPLQA